MSRDEQDAAMGAFAREAKASIAANPFPVSRYPVKPFSKDVR